LTLHLIKLCVGVDSVADLREWQTERLAQLKKRGQKLELKHTTRMVPKRQEEILAGGSLYWVIKGVIRVRQRIIGVESIVWDGEPHCKLVLQRKLVRVMPRPMRAFQGWRYLEAKDAPPDLDHLGKGAVDMPPKMVEELRSLGLL
jgi:hypothetical protein